ncbi:MAG: hypothetical protein ACRC33_19655 [Gemmataceae bacterium]
MTADDIGRRGENIFIGLISELYPGRLTPYFRPCFLGDKFSTFDFLVQLVGSEEHYFFVQVKTTRQGYRGAPGTQHLLVNVPHEDIVRMVACPIPSYIVGIDEPQKLGYVLSMNEPRPTGLGGLPARHLLDCPTLARLWNEVRGYWATHPEPVLISWDGGETMTDQEPWFYTERAEAFASLALTEVRDVSVRPYAGTDMAIDLRVELLRGGKPTWQFIAVYLIPYLDQMPPDSADRCVPCSLGRDPVEAQWPVCAFLIEIRKLNGVFRWVREPAVRDGRAELIDGEKDSWHPIDTANITRLIEQAREWYDLRSEATRNGREETATL